MIALGVIIGIIVILAMVAIGYKNKFVVLDNRVKNSWSQIDVQMQNRFSLVPNLVETVKGYAKHEKETFEGIANAKTRYMSATTPQEKMEANNQLSGFLGRLFAISEAYPELKADQTMGSLMTELTNTEDKIAYQREYYNRVVGTYNVQTEVFPSNVIAGMFGFIKKEFLKSGKRT